MDRQTKIQYLHALEEQKQRKRAAPLFYMAPHPKQQDFLQKQTEKRVVLFSGGNRSGKTWAHAYTAICHAYGYWINEAFDSGEIALTDNGDYPKRADVPPKFWLRRPDGVPFRVQRNILLVTGLSMPKGIGQVLWPEIENCLPFAMMSKLKVKRGPMSIPVSIHHPDGDWVINFGSIEQGSMAFEGAKYDAVGFDEPPSRTVFTAVWRGCTDFFAPVWLTFTPLGHNAPWIYEEFYAGEREDVGVIEVSQAENPHLSTEALTAFEQGVQFSEEELLARQSGKFGFLTYRAFQTFDEKTHVIDSFDIPSSWPRLLACDPASRRPFYFVWLAYDEVRETWIAYDEFPDEKLHHQYRNSDWTVNDYATIIRNREGGTPVDGRVVDPRFGPAEYTIKGQKTTSVVDDFARLGLYFDARVPDTGREETGLQRINQLLWYDTRAGISPTNKPKLVFFPQCKSLIHALGNYSFVPPDLRDERILKDKTNEAFKDPIDALRYGILYGVPLSSRQDQSGYIDGRDLENENALDDWL